MTAMGKRKWFPTQEAEIETALYRYTIGVYDHAKYGEGCFRISKFLKESGFFIGHFVVVPEDQDTVLPAMADAIKGVVEVQTEQLSKGDNHGTKTS